MIPLPRRAPSASLCAHDLLCIFIAELRFGELEPLAEASVLDRAEEPWSVHFEVRLAGHLEKERLLVESDVISLHVPLMPSTSMDWPAMAFAFFIAP